MAITATFRADFTSFVDAVNRAETELRSFETGAAKVEKSLSRMTDAFSGRRIIQDAQLTAKAIDDIGGVSKLTEGELKRVSVQAQEAVAKLKAMGLEVPPGIQKIADATKATGGAFDSLKGPLSAVNGLLGTFGIGLSIGAVVGFGKSLLDDADALVKMSDRTGITITGLQRLQVAGDDAGNTIEDMTGAVNQMQNRLDGGDASAVGALRRLGISLADIKQLTPDQQFMAISDALRQVEDPAQQVAIAMDLFGKTGATVLPTLKRGFDDVRDSAVGMSEDTARALDSMGDSLAKFWRQSKGVGAEVAVFGARYGDLFLNPIGASFRHAIDYAKEMKAVLDDVLATASKKVPEGAGIQPLQIISASDALEELNKGLKEETAAADRAVEKQKAHNAELQTLRERALAAGRALESAIGRGTFTGVSPEAGVAAALAQARARLAELERQDTLPGRTLTGLPRLQSGANAQLAALSQTFGKNVADVFSVQVPQALMAAITGGGSKLEAIGSTLGSFLTSEKGFGGVIKKGLTSVFGASFGGALNALVPGLGVLMGPLLSAMGKKIKALFGGPSEEELGGRAIEKQFEDSFGSFDNMVNAIGEAYRQTGRSSEDAQRDVKALLDAEKQGPAAVQAWIDKFNDAIAKAKELHDAVSDAFDIDRPNWGDLGDFGPVVPIVDGAATGAKVLSFGLQHLARGGFASRGSDTVPAMLTPGELVLNAAQQKNVAGAMASGGASVTVIINNPSYDTPAGRQRALDATSKAVIESLKRQRRLA